MLNIFLLAALILALFITSYRYMRKKKSKKQIFHNDNLIDNVFDLKYL
jgi:hypothetical protein